MDKNNILFYVLLLLFLNCEQDKKSKVQTNEFLSLEYSKDILNYRLTPKDSLDKSGLMFSDQGAWFAYGFQKTTKNLIGFSGPFLMTEQNGVWASKSLTSIFITINDVPVSMKEEHIVHQTSYSSHLEQTFNLSGISLKTSLVFINGHTALIKYAFKNNGKGNSKIDYYWKNEPVINSLEFSFKENIAEIRSNKTNALGYITFPESTVIKGDSGSLLTESQSISLAPNESKEFIISHTFIFPEYSWKKEQVLLENVDFDSVLKARKVEKNVQIASLINNRKPEFQSKKYAEVLAKAHLTLQNNWRIPAGELKYEGLFPSYHYKWFNGFWAWDSWKHAVGLSYYDTNLAKNQMRTMFDFQKDDGFIVDCVYRDTTIEAHNYRDTKPPLSVWAVAKIYEKDKDIEFVKEFYPKLKKYHEWWYKKRDHDQDGLCEYGSTDGSLIAAKWESGMDNAIRFDGSKILKNEEGAYSLDQESVDLNAYLYAEKLYLKHLATILKLDEDANRFSKESESLKADIQTQFFDEGDGWFYDTNLEGTKFIKGEGSEGWTALWVKAATPEQAEAVKNKMIDTKKFYTKVPFQTMSADHEKFNPLRGYWRGPNWLDQAYFGVKGLRNYGFKEAADKAAIQIIEGAEGVLTKGKSIRENYHPLTGKGLNAENFSWSAAHIIMLLQND